MSLLCTQAHVHNHCDSNEHDCRHRQSETHRVQPFVNSWYHLSLHIKAVMPCTGHPRLFQPPYLGPPLLRRPQPRPRVPSPRSARSRRRSSSW